ncbi:LysR family transcriptional regulator [Salinivibrio kushneri]|uniref:LysR family transcriptional regulator n=1 Tax=Salinivibrio kushneri TaxID=1908198 RepID=UPI0022B49DEF|nr:LysR family transcriptional regulator [Salinivibrio kushneri]WBA13483.1 LysR family transcriptional regulator [Salinivibrio kushneri]
MDVEKVAGYFIAVVEAGGIKAAALQLGISQPSLTAQIQKLEQRFACPLLVRHPRGVSMTAAGELYYQHATALHAERQRLYAQIHALQAREAGQIKLGTGEAWWPLFVKPAVLEYQADRQCAVHIEFGNRLALMASLLSGDVDVFIGHEIDDLVASQQVRFMPLFQDAESYYVADSHPLLTDTSASIDPQRLSDWPLMRVTPDHARHAHLLANPISPTTHVNQVVFDVDALSPGIDLLHDTQAVMPYTSRAQMYLASQGVSVLGVHPSKRGNVGLYTLRNERNEKVDALIQQLCEAAQQVGISPRHTS